MAMDINKHQNIVQTYVWPHQLSFPIIFEQMSNWYAVRRINNYTVIEVDIQLKTLEV